MNQNNEDRQLSVFEMDANDDETDVVFLEQAYGYHQQFVAEENRLPLTRNLINRDREGAEERLMADYFNDHYRVRPDATGRMSLSVIMKCTTAICQLAYDTTPDAFDEYLQMSERTTRDSLTNFNKCIISLYMVEYLRKPTLEDVENRRYGRGSKKHPTIMLEAVASQDLWIWHAFFGVAGANNDINVLDNSPLFDDLLNDTTPVLSYVANGVGYEKGYYLNRCPRSLQLWGTLGAGTKPFKVYIGRSETLLYENMCSQLGKVTHDYSKKTMEFTWSDHGYTLRGDEALRMKRISLHHMRALLEKEDSSTEERGSSTDVQVITHPDIEQLLARFKEIFQTKCVFGATTFKYLGHIISGRGVEVDPKKVSAVIDWPIPMSQRRWGGSEGKAFNELKDKLTHAPILGLLDFEDTFVIESDASDVGLGAVLLRKGQQLGYFSRKLGPRMSIATTYQKELFSIVEAVYKWR
nr:hypothetical protein [Tanacetum cinerariifolium]